MSKNSQQRVRLALIGKGIAHSKSQLMYERILGYEINYTLLDIESDSKLPSLDELFLNYQGVSITTPYKQSYLSVVMPSKIAQEVGAINCIVKNANGYAAENTDCLAIKAILLDKVKRYPDLKVVVVGSGVMSRVVAITCLELNIPYDLFSRKGSSDFLCREFKQENPFTPLLIVNCCNREFVFKNKLQGNIHFWDLNYNYPAHHYLKDKVAHFEDGLELLEKQAKFALQFWSIL